MRIAICDDEPKELELLHSFLLRYDATLPYTLFSSAQDLLDASSSTFFDIIFMDIYYFEIYGHVLHIYTTHGVYPYRASLSDVISVLNGTHFAQPHKSFYVNLAYIDHLNARRLFLTTGTKIPIASLRKNEFMQAFQSFLRSK